MDGYAPIPKIAKHHLLHHFGLQNLFYIGLLVLCTKLKLPKKLLPERNRACAPLPLCALRTRWRWKCGSMRAGKML
jgi:hypothetical protein